MKLHKLYNLISRNAAINLIDPKHQKVYFHGSVRGMPDTFDNWSVHDLTEISYNEYIIEITKK